MTAMQKLLDRITSKHLTQYQIQVYATELLEQEKEQLKDAYQSGHFDGNDGNEMDFDYYYSLTYNHGN